MFMSASETVGVQQLLIKHKLAQLVEHRHVNPEVAGSNPALVHFSLFIQNLSKHKKKHLKYLTVSHHFLKIFNYL